MVQQKFSLVPNTFVWIILATTSLAWTSIVQIVMIFILSPALRFPRSREIRAFSRAIWGRTEIMDIEVMPSFVHLNNPWPGREAQAGSRSGVDDANLLFVIILNGILITFLQAVKSDTNLCGPGDLGAGESDLQQTMGTTRP